MVSRFARNVLSAYLFFLFGRGKRQKEGNTKKEEYMTYIGKSKVDQRKAHWDEIRSRVTTHEGEFLSGSKGQAYQQKYGKKYLGIEARPANYNTPEYQRELAKTK